jgi:hypothetical protein
MVARVMLSSLCFEYIVTFCHQHLNETLENNGGDLPFDRRSIRVETEVIFSAKPVSSASSDEADNDMTVVVCGMMSA